MIYYSFYSFRKQVAAPFSFGDNAGVAVLGIYYSGFRHGGRQLAVQLVGKEMVIIITVIYFILLLLLLIVQLVGTKKCLPINLILI